MNTDARSYEECLQSQILLDEASNEANYDLDESESDQGDENDYGQDLDDDLPIWDDDDHSNVDEDADDLDFDSDSDSDDADSDDADSDDESDEEWDDDDEPLAEDHSTSDLDDYRSSFIKYEDDHWQDRDGHYYTHEEFIEELESAWHDEQQY